MKQLKTFTWFTMVNGFNSSTDPKRNYALGSEAGKVPETYIIVRNNDLILNSHLLIFADGKASGATTVNQRRYQCFIKHLFIT
jgi:hypothetical protein